MQYITILDYILLPFYLAFFYWRAKRMSSKLAEPDLRKCLFLAFGFKMLGSFAYSMLVQYYYGYGDTFVFYGGGNFFTDQAYKNPGDISYLFSSFKEISDIYIARDPDPNGYFSVPSNNMVMRISAVLSYLSFNRYLIIALFFGFFSFLGHWKLFLVFDDINEGRNRKLLALTTLCAPSIWFWSGGLLKDSICLGAMGYVVYILYNFFVKKKFSLGSLIALLFLSYIVFIIKSYIISIFLAGFIIMSISVFFKSITNKLIRAFMFLLTIIIAVVILYEGDFSSQINAGTEEAVSQIKEFQHNYSANEESNEDIKSGFGIGEIDPSINSLIMKSPLVVFTCLFRPFPWESRKLIIFLTSLESILVLLATLFVMIRMGILRFFWAIFNSPHLLFCFTITIFFSLIIGFTTFNFGTMIRYKVIFVPFYYYLLVYLYTQHIWLPKKVAMAKQHQPIA